MKPSPLDATASVEQLLRAEFPDAAVTSENVPTRHVRLFRIRSRNAAVPAMELEISYVAFEDSTSDTLVADLRRVRVADELRRAQDHRLLFTSRGRLFPAG